MMRVMRAVCMLGLADAAVACMYGQAQKSGGTTQQPAAGQLLVTSEPSGLKVHLQKHETTPKTNLVRQGFDEKLVPRGQTPLLLDISPGDYSVAVEYVFSPGASPVAQVPRGCRSSFSFSGSTVFFECFKCNYYPDETYRDPLDPFERDGNIGICFHAPTDPETPVRYFRIYKLLKGEGPARLAVRFKK